MKTNNPSKFIDTAIDIFKRKVIAENKPEGFNKPRFDANRFYTAGHCAEFAFSLAKFASENNIEANVTIMYSNVISPEDGGVLDKTFSHCIVELDNEYFDATGSDARSTWFLKHDYIYQDEENIEREWEFVTIPFSDSDSVFKSLKEHCDLHGIYFTKDQIKKDESIFKSIIENKKEMDTSLSS